VLEPVGQSTNWSRSSIYVKIKKLGFSSPVQFPFQRLWFHRQWYRKSPIYVAWYQTVPPTGSSICYSNVTDYGTMPLSSFPPSSSSCTWYFKPDTASSNSLFLAHTSSFRITPCSGSSHFSILLGACSRFVLIHV